MEVARRLTHKQRRTLSREDTSGGPMGAEQQRGAHHDFVCCWSGRERVEDVSIFRRGLADANCFKKIQPASRAGTCQRSVPVSACPAPSYTGNLKGNHALLLLGPSMKS